MSDSEGEDYSESSRSEDAASEEEEEGSITATIETSRLLAILNSFSLIGDHTFFLFTEEGLVMFPENLNSSAIEKKTKRKKNKDDKYYHEPKISCRFNAENILYAFNFPSDEVFISFLTKDIINNIKHYGKKEPLMLQIDANDPSVIYYTSAISSSSLSGIVSMRGRSVDSGLYAPPDIESYEEPMIKYTCNEIDFKRILNGIGNSTGKTEIDCSLNVSASGFMIEARTESGTQSYRLGNTKLGEKKIAEVKWNKKTIVSLKKLQIVDGVCSFCYRKNDPLTIERKIANIADIIFSFTI